MNGQLAAWIQDIFEEVRYTYQKYIRNPIRYRTTDRYHILDLRDGGNGYNVGWYDTDTRMLQANFLLLKEYVEKEEPFRIINWDEMEETRVVGEEIKFLYDWWIKDRGEKHATLHKEWATIKAPRLTPREGGGVVFRICDKSRELLERRDLLDKEDDEMLLRLIKIRHYLWT